MKHENMSGINIAIEQGYHGPACLYKILGHNQKRNPLMLRRNPLVVMHSRRKKCKRACEGFSVTAKVLNAASNRLSFFLVSESVEDDKQMFEVVDSSSVIAKDVNTFQTLFSARKLKKLNFSILTSIHILIMHSPSENTQDSDLYRAICLCKRLNGFSFGEHHTEEVSLKLKAPMAMVEVKQFFSQFYTFAPVHAHIVPNPRSFRSYFYPYLSQAESSIYELSNRFSCRMFNLAEMDQTNSVFSLSIYPVASRSISSSVEQKDLQPRKRTREMISHLSQTIASYCKVSLTYHLLVKLEEKGKYLEFYNSSNFGVECLWCGLRFGKSLYFNRETRKLASFSATYLWQLLQHSACCHYHLSGKFFLAEDGHMHIYASPTDSELLDKTVFKGSKFFENMKAAKLNHQNIFLHPWSKDNPPALSKISTEFFHSSTGLPISLQDMGYDSDDNDVDKAATINHRNVVIDEFCDITLQEKEFMKLWNIHLASFPSHGDKFLPVVCQRFVTKFRHVIVEKNLRHNLLLHLLNLWDFGLLVAEEIYQYMQFVDQVMIEG